MDNQRALELRQKFLETEQSKYFDELWQETVNMVNPHKYFDPSGARTKEDFLQVTRIGLYEALLSFKEGAGSTILTWIRMRMNQLLIKEVKRIDRNKFKDAVSFDNTSILDGPNRTIEELIYSQLVDKNSYQHEWSDDIYWKIIADVQQRLSYNIKIEETFKLKMIFPNIERKTICKLLGVSKPALSSYFEIIKNTFLEVIPKYAF